jgi:stalled ribosome rescue protein Dom34
MKQNVGLWIDHRKAIVVTIEDDKEAVQVIESNVEQRVRLSGGSRTASPYGPQEVAAEGKRDERYRHHLDAYYREVIKAICDADSILIFGPGEAKGELKKALEESRELGRRIVGVESADKMTQPQIAAKTRDYFAKKRPSRRA